MSYSLFCHQGSKTLRSTKALVNLCALVSSWQKNPVRGLNPRMIEVSVKNLHSKLQTDCYEAPAHRPLLRLLAMTLLPLSFCMLAYYRHCSAYAITFTSFGDQRKLQRQREVSKGRLVGRNAVAICLLCFLKILRSYTTKKKRLRSLSKNYRRNFHPGNLKTIIFVL